MSDSARHVTVSIPAREACRYEVSVGAGQLSAGLAVGLADRPPEELVARLAESQPRRALLVTDRTVEALYADAVAAALGRAGCETLRLVMEPGEAHKSRATLARFQDEALAWGVDRSTLVVALGGGVVGDLGGYLAASLLRGLQWALVPTTLLAMVDSAVGGKTGVDTAAGKNLVGAFWQPRFVLADVEVLASLPEAEMSAGLAEVIKYGVILEEQLFTDLEDGLLESCLARVPEALAIVVERCVMLKADVVQSDEREAGRRQILNFGHTVAHAVEAVGGYSLRHGEAVAIGMVVEAHLAQAQGGAQPDLAERIEELCLRAGLPVRLPEGMSRAAVLEAARLDKKNVGAQLLCALPLEIGRMAGSDAGWTTAVSDEELLAALRRP